VATREEVIYQVRMQGVPQLVADARTATTATDRLKASARSASIPIGAPGGVSATGYIASTEVEIEHMRRQAALLGTRAAANVAALDRQVAAEAAAAKTAARRKPAFGERGRAIAMATGAGRFAGLAAPFGGWGPLLAIGAGFTALHQFKAGAENIGLNQQLSAQTAAGIKSTGGAANVTAAHVDKLAVSLGKLAGIQDETVHDSENILLTFANIRNEVGKGNKVFDLSALAVANVASRMHTDMPQAALQVGKALNDPIRGMGALRRIGVQFTAAQEDAIKVMIASGNRMGAQKIILHELNVEFGGSAKAAGTTLPAAMVALSESWERARNKLVIRLMPAATSFTNWLARTLPGAVDTAMTAMSVFNTTPNENVLSRWVHRTFGGTAGDAFDYTLKTSGKQALHDIGRHTLTHQMNINPAFTGSPADVKGLAERRRQQAAVGGVMLDENGRPTGGDAFGGMGSSTPFSAAPVKIKWEMGDPLESRPIYLLADNQVLARLMTKQQQKRTHAEGRGTTNR
jgi:hypothetical protein